MSQRKKATLLILAAATPMLLIILASRPAEPMYRGHRLSYWVDRLQAAAREANLQATYMTADPAPPAEALEAIRSIGTNATPFLLKWISHRPAAWRTTLNARTPRLSQHVLHFFNDAAAVNRAQAASMAFVALGTNAAPAIPSLGDILNDYRHPLSSRFALSILSDLGPKALPHLLKASTNAPSGERIFIQQAIMLNLASSAYKRADLPLLQRTYQHKDAPVSLAASNAIWRIAPAALTTNSPAQ